MDSAAPQPIATGTGASADASAAATAVLTGSVLPASTSAGTELLTLAAAASIGAGTKTGSPADSGLDAAAAAASDRFSGLDALTQSRTQSLPAAIAAAAAPLIGLPYVHVTAPNARSQHAAESAPEAAPEPALDGITRITPVDPTARRAHNFESFDALTAPAAAAAAAAAARIAALPYQSLYETRTLFSDADSDEPMRSPPPPPLPALPLASAAITPLPDLVLPPLPPDVQPPAPAPSPPAILLPPHVKRSATSPSAAIRVSLLPDRRPDTAVAPVLLLDAIPPALAAATAIAAASTSPLDVSLPAAQPRRVQIDSDATPGAYDVVPPFSGAYTVTSSSFTDYYSESDDRPAAPAPPLVPAADLAAEQRTLPVPAHVSSFSDVFASDDSLQQPTKSAPSASAAKVQAAAPVIRLSGPPAYARFAPTSAVEAVRMPPPQDPLWSSLAEHNPRADAATSLAARWRLALLPTELPKRTVWIPPTAEPSGGDAGPAAELQQTLPSPFLAPPSTDATVAPPSGSDAVYEAVWSQTDAPATVVAPAPAADAPALPYLPLAAAVAATAIVGTAIHSLATPASVAAPADSGAIPLTLIGVESDDTASFDAPPALVVDVPTVSRTSPAVVAVPESTAPAPVASAPVAAPVLPSAPNSNSFRLNFESEPAPAPSAPLRPASTSGAAGASALAFPRFRRWLIAAPFVSWFDSVWDRWIDPLSASRRVLYEHRAALTATNPHARTAAGVANASGTHISDDCRVCCGSQLVRSGVPYADDYRQRVIELSLRACRDVDREGVTPLDSSTADRTLRTRLKPFARYCVVDYLTTTAHRRGWIANRWLPLWLLLRGWCVSDATRRNWLIGLRWVWLAATRQRQSAHPQPHPIARFVAACAQLLWSIVHAIHRIKLNGITINRPKLPSVQLAAESGALTSTSAPNTHSNGSDESATSEQRHSLVIAALHASAAPPAAAPAVAPAKKHPTVIAAIGFHRTAALHPYSANGSRPPPRDRDSHGLSEDPVNSLNSDFCDVRSVLERNGYHDQATASVATALSLPTAASTPPNGSSKPARQSTAKSGHPSTVSWPLTRSNVLRRIERLFHRSPSDDEHRPSYALCLLAHGQTEAGGGDFTLPNSQRITLLDILHRFEASLPLAIDFVHSAGRGVGARRTDAPQPSVIPHLTLLVDYNFCGEWVYECATRERWYQRQWLNRLHHHSPSTHQPHQLQRQPSHASHQPHMLVPAWFNLSIQSSTSAYHPSVDGRFVRRWKRFAAASGGAAGAAEDRSKRFPFAEAIFRLFERLSTAHKVTRVQWPLSFASAAAAAAGMPAFPALNFSSVSDELDMPRRVNGWYRRLFQTFQPPGTVATRSGLASSARVDCIARLIIDYGCVPMTEEEAHMVLA